MYKNYRLTAVLTLGLLLMPLLALAEDNQSAYVPKPVYNDKGEIIGTTRGTGGTGAWLPEGYSVLDTQEGDVTGDGTSDTVYVIGHKREANSAYMDSIKVFVENGADQSRTEVALDKLAGYEAQVVLRDFTGDQIPDALITVATGGNGGMYLNRVVTFTGEPTVLFSDKDDQGNFVSGQFIDGYKAEIRSATGPTVTIDTSARKDDYLRLGIYDQTGKLIKPTKLMISPSFGKLEPVDVNHDGIYELQGSQRISGAYRADGLATVETVLAYTDGSWQPKSVNLRILLMNNSR